MSTTTPTRPSRSSSSRSSSPRGSSSAGGRPPVRPGASRLRTVPGRGRRRIGVVLAIWLVVSLAIGWRLVALQVREADDLSVLASRQTDRDLEVPASRGRIYDRDLAPLATSVTSVSVYAHPRQVAEAGPGAVGRTAGALAALLGQPVGDIAAELQRDVPFVYLGRQLDLGLEQRVADARLPGVGTLREPRREYPVADIGAQVVGVAGVDDVGLSGMERRFDDLLRGTPGRIVLARGADGLTIGGAPQQLVSALPGTDLVLTLDREIQEVTQRALATAVEEHGAEAGSAVVLDVTTGDVLAMASLPTRSDSGTSARLRAVTDAFEPGSIGKVVTVAGALEDDLVGPSTTFTVADSLQVGGRTYRDSHSHATKPMTVAEIMADSSNVGTIQIAQRLGEERMREWVERFGFGEPTGVGFPGEVGGYVPALDDWTNASLPTIAIGQGLSATSLQLASVFATIGSGGERIEPRLVKGTIGADGRLDAAPASPRHRVVSPATARRMTAMLESVVGDGTGGNAQIQGYRVAGKTGTAQKAYEDRRGYEPGAYMSSFAGFAPVDAPRVAVIVTLDEPSDSYYGGTVAAPAFAEITRAALRDLRVPSDPAHVVRPVTDAADEA